MTTNQSVDECQRSYGNALATDCLLLKYLNVFSKQTDWRLDWCVFATTAYYSTIYKYIPADAFICSLSLSCSVVVADENNKLWLNLF